MNTAKQKKKQLEVNTNQKRHMFLIFTFIFPHHLTNGLTYYVFMLSRFAIRDKLFSSTLE